MPWLVLRLLALKSWLLRRITILPTKTAGIGIFVIALLTLCYPRPVYAAPLLIEGAMQNIAYIAFSVASALTQVIVLLIDAMVPIMTYNNFVDNPVVKAGWAIMRDTVNMFFVVILIIIAFGTIFGNERFKWQQQVPRLLTMAIVINFSKTLCGIMIDFGQVIMLTFANALREIAAGNFIQLLGLNQIYSVSTGSSITSGTNVYDYFAAGIASVLVVVWVLATLIIMVAVLAFRIVMLWVLVVIAPLAWFVKGADGIIKSDAYKDWWEQFKCLVSVGPILAFFLWLTLAVAGAGNIAANSGFDVDTGSNNSDLASSLFELNNLLSFVIAMSLLFAGLMTASRFCASGMSGGMIGKTLDKAKAFNPANVARLTAGLGAKAGGYGARLAGRGLAATPGAAAAASRYLPPTVRNIPNNLNPLNASRRAALAGALGRSLGDNAAGRYFKGWEADLEFGGRARKFVGVQKERDGMKDKSREWKQGQLESMLKRPPITQVGKDKLAALFEEAMADHRLQEQMLKKDPNVMKVLWESQGKNYEDMAKGNSAKTSNLKDFKKKYAHITDSVDQLKTAADFKGLSADAWEDDAVRERASALETTIEKGKDKDGKKIYMNVLEAAQSGKLVEGDAEVKAAANRQATIDSSLTHEKNFDAMVRNGDLNGFNVLLERLESQYTNTATSQEDRAKLARSMDRMRAAGERLEKDGIKGAGDILSSLNTRRTAMETKSGFGLPSSPKAGESADEYVDKHFGQASAGRIDAAMAKVDSDKTAADGIVASLDAQVQALRGVEKQIADKQQQIADVRRRIQQSVDKDVQNAYQPLRRAKKNLAAAQQKGNAQDIARYQQVVDKTQSDYDQTKVDGAAELANSSEIARLEAQVQAEITDAGGQARLDEVQEKVRRLSEQKDQATRLEEIKKRLQQERARRS